MKLLTVNDLIAILQTVRNKDAVVYVVGEGVSGENFGSIDDQTVNPPEADGHIGNLYFMLDNQGSFMRALAQDSPNDVLVKLQGEADDGESMTVEELAIKAGYWWKCSPEDCGCVNDAGDEKCSACGTPRPLSAGGMYTMCKRCEHFVDENPITEGDFYFDDPEKPADVEGLARYIHLDDGEQEFDHEPDPGMARTGKEWHRLRPDLFRDYPDGKIGPNSVHHSRRGKDDRIRGYAHAPKVWKALIETVFPEGLAGILSEKQDHTGTADPKPHYDDLREVEGTFTNDDTFVLRLASGQSNYFGGLTIRSDQGVDWDSEPWERFDDTFEVELERDGQMVKYLLEIIWEEPDAQG